MDKCVSAALFFFCQAVIYNLRFCTQECVAVEILQNDSVCAEVLAMFSFHFSCVILHLQALMTYIFSSSKHESTQHSRRLFESQHGQKLILTCV